MEIRQIKWRTARRVCDAHHYLGSPVGQKFSLGIYEGWQLLGEMIWGQPVARVLDDGETLEMTRMCLMIQRANLASQSLSKAVKWIRQNRSEKRLISYSDGNHKGTIYAAAGWSPTPTKGGGKWKSGRGRRATVRWERQVHKFRQKTKTTGAQYIKEGDPE